MSLDVLEEAFAENNISDSSIGIQIIKYTNNNFATQFIHVQVSEGFFDSVFHSMSVQIFQRHKYQNRLILELRHENLKRDGSKLCTAMQISDKMIKCNLVLTFSASMSYISFKRENSELGR